MTKRVVTVPVDESFPRIVKLLIKKRISGAPVVDKRGNVVGVISEKDLFYKLFPSQKKFYRNLRFYMNYDNIFNEAKKVSKYKAKNLMSKKVISITPDAHILKACSIFLTKNIRRLPVIENGKLVGIVTTNNIYKNFLSNLVE